MNELICILSILPWDILLLHLTKINLVEEIYSSLYIGNKLCVDLGLQFQCDIIQHTHTKFHLYRNVKTIAKIKSNIILALGVLRDNVEDVKIVF